MAYAVRALWDFTAGNGDELSFLTGDILQVTNSSDPDWWEAVDANGNRGLIPANRVSRTRHLGPRLPPGAEARGASLRCPSVGSADLGSPRVCLCVCAGAGARSRRCRRRS